MGVAKQRYGIDVRAGPTLLLLRHLTDWPKVGVMVSEQPGETPGPQLAATIQGILEERGTIDFMTVARAMVLQAHEKGAEAAREMADLLGISRQTRHNWLKPESVSEWQQQWAERLAGARDKGAPASLIRRKLSDSDWQWIAGVLATFPVRSWNKRRAAIEREAAKENSGMGHLRGIHRVTLFRNRGRLVRLGEELRKARIAASQAQLNRVPDQSANAQSGDMKASVAGNVRSFSAANTMIGEAF
jgi:hypothetical protein